MSCMMNPLLYGLTNSSLRRELRHLWQDIFCQGKTDAEDRHCHYRNRRFRSRRYDHYYFLFFSRSFVLFSSSFKKWQSLNDDSCSIGGHKTYFSFSSSFRYGKDGEIDRPIYDKEGVYLGKVNQGTCMCSGCVESRREVKNKQNKQTQINKQGSRTNREM
jgi:hypothetical protein